MRYLEKLLPDQRSVLPLPSLLNDHMGSEGGLKFGHTISLVDAGREMGSSGERLTVKFLKSGVKSLANGNIAADNQYP